MAEITQELASVDLTTAGETAPAGDQSVAPNFASDVPASDTQMSHQPDFNFGQNEPLSKSDSNGPIADDENADLAAAETDASISHDSDDATSTVLSGFVPASPVGSSTATSNYSVDSASIDNGVVTPLEGSSYGIGHFLNSSVPGILPGSTSPLTPQDYWIASDAAYAEETLAEKPGGTPPDEAQLKIDANNAVAAVGGAGWTAIDVAYMPSKGFYASAFETPSGQIVIAFEGTLPNPFSQYGRAALNDDVSLLEQLTPKTLFEEDVSFAKAIFSYAAANGISKSDIFVTGHSLGGTQAEYIADRFGLAGASFGAFGLPVYTSGGLVPNFLDYVDYGDPVGNYASGMPTGMGQPGLSGMDHYGEVVPEGNPANYSSVPTIFGYADSTALAMLAMRLGFAPYHDIENYLDDLTGVSVVTLPAPTPELVLETLDASLGASGISDLASLKLVNSYELETSNFIVETNAAGTIVSVTQRQFIIDGVQTFGSDPGTDTIDFEKGTDAITAETFKDSLTGDTIQFLPDANTIGDKQNVSFVSSAADTLLIDNPTSFVGHISQFNPGDTIDLSDIGTAVSAALGANDTISVTGPYGQMLSVKLTGGNYINDSFVVTPDGDGGTDISVAANGVPVTTVPDSEIMTAGQSAALNPLSVGVADGVLYSGNLTVKLTDTSGILSASQEGQGTVAGSGTGALTISGSLADVNNELLTVIYTASSTPGSDSIHVVTADSDGDSESHNITVATTAPIVGGNISWEYGLSGTWASGYWSTGYYNSDNQWVPGPPPGPGDNALVDVGGTYDIYVEQSVHVSSLTIDAPGASVSAPDESMEVDGDLTLVAGALSVGTLSDATVIPAGGTLSVGEFVNVTYEGAFNFADATVDNLTVTGPGGSGPGTVEVGGELTFAGNQTFDNATIVMGAFLEIAGTLTFGPNAIVDQVESGEEDIQNSLFSSGGSIVNEGTINAEATKGTLLVTVPLTNTGSVIVANGDYAGFEEGLINQGDISIVSGGELDVDSGTETLAPYENSGRIYVSPGSTLSLATVSLTTSEFGSIENLGTLEFGGTLDNEGSTLRIGEGTALGTFELNACSISGGIILDAGGALEIANYPAVGTVGPPVLIGPFFDGVTYEGTLSIGATSVEDAMLTIVDGLTVVGSKGSGPGTINLSANGSNLEGTSFLNFQGTQTLNNATINLADGAIVYSDPDGTGTILTLGSHITINVLADSYGTLGVNEFQTDTFPAGDGIVLDGVINASGSGSNLDVDGSVFTNKGTITVSGDSTFVETTATFVNDATVDVSGSFLSVFYTLSGKGVINLSEDSTARIAGSAAATETFVFKDGSGNVLWLADAPGFGAVIQGFQEGDYIRLSSDTTSSETTFNYSDGALTIYPEGSGSSPIKLNLPGTFETSGFFAESLGSDGTEIYYVPPTTTHGTSNEIGRHLMSGSSQHADVAPDPHHQFLHLDSNGRLLLGETYMDSEVCRTGGFHFMDLHS